MNRNTTLYHVSIAAAAAATVVVVGGAGAAVLLSNDTAGSPAAPTPHSVATTHVSTAAKAQNLKADKSQVGQIIKPQPVPQQVQVQSPTDFVPPADPVTINVPSGANNNSNGAPALGGSYIPPLPDDNCCYDHGKDWKKDEHHDSNYCSYDCDSHHDDSDHHDDKDHRDNGDRHEDSNQNKH